VRRPRSWPAPASPRPPVTATAGDRCHLWAGCAAPSGEAGSDLVVESRQPFGAHNRHRRRVAEGSGRRREPGQVGYPEALRSRHGDPAARHRDDRPASSWWAASPGSGAATWAPDAAPLMDTATTPAPSSTGPWARPRSPGGQDRRSCGEGADQPLQRDRKAGRLLVTKEADRHAHQR
jgi:hypothetical protein